MPDPADILQDLIDTVKEANDSCWPLRIIGGETKAFYGRAVEGQRLSVAKYQGIVAYEPTELVLTARAGTRLTEIEEVLAAQGQMLAFEPPHFGVTATLGGMVAVGLSGPRRPYVGAVRDFILGVKCLTGAEQIVSFGGQVMKNVAGFDVSRLMAGVLGTLGVLLEISLKVLPAPEHELTLQREATAQEAIAFMNRWAGQSLPLSAACHDGARLYLRLSGSYRGVTAASAKIGGERLTDGAIFWRDLREHRLAFFAPEQPPLWRLSVPPATPPLDLPGEQLIDWGGAQRWLRSHAAPELIRQAARDKGGHALVFRGGDRQAEVFSPLSPALEQMHRRLKQAFDPHRIFNPGRMYSYL
ncbi:MAG TPA: glycolate oxidase subunit GlcE [Gammaproteobacteria bacterium]|nr:glycolate oxidase subunit GlcE [Gammaproteobacteria bacterium]